MSTDEYSIEDEVIDALFVFNVIHSKGLAWIIRDKTRLNLPGFLGLLKIGQLNVSNHIIFLPIGQ